MTYIAVGIAFGVTMAYLDRYCFNDAIEKWLALSSRRLMLSGARTGTAWLSPVSVEAIVP
jgi:hypothetical protein